MVVKTVMTGGKLQGGLGGGVETPVRGEMSG